MSNNKGTVIQVMGPVLDIRFADGQLPLLLSRLPAAPLWTPQPRMPTK